MNNCQDIEVPEVNNQNSNCYEFKNANCIIVTDIDQDLLTYFGFGEDPNLNTVLNKIAAALKGAKQDINDLENSL